MALPTRLLVGIGVFTTAAVGVGVYAHYKAAPAPAKKPIIDVGGVLPLLLTNGIFTSPPVSVKQQNVVTIYAPPGATVPPVSNTAMPSGGVGAMVTTSDGKSVQIHADPASTAPGLAVVSVPYTLANGTSQVCTLQILVIP
jgi:hypothetical protein